MKQKAFTLIELLVVIAIIGILSSVIFTNITGLRDRAKVMAGIRFDSSTLHSIGDQLVGEWTFDVPAANLTDSSGAGLNLTNSGLATYATTSGYNGKGAYSFNGSTNYLSVSASSLPSGALPRTVCAWAKLNSAPTYQGIAGYGNNTTSGTSFYVSKYGSNWYLWSLGATDLDTGVVADNNWNSHCGVYDGTTIFYYLNGNLIGKKVAVLNTSNVNFQVGKVVTYSYFASGLIDDVRIYSSALSASEIQKLYADGISSHEVATK